MDLDTQIRHLDPLQLARADSPDEEVKVTEAKTLREVLDSGDRGTLSSEIFLNAFYEKKDLNVRVDRGFYQKPFIGAPVMGIFADSLRNPNSAAGSQVQFTPLESKAVRFFICGSLHGGTGACGLPIMGKFLHERKVIKGLDKWEIGGGLLAPYGVPPAPPFQRPKVPQEITDSLVDQYIRDYGDLPAFSGLTPEEKKELIKQILQGFYADPEEMQARARQSLVFYKDHGAAYFDQLYLIGKPEPDILKIWSNGGKTQLNPLNSAEVVGALAALNFFSGSKPGNPDSYIIGTSTHTVDSRKMKFYDLPHYLIGGRKIDTERAFLVMLVLRHLLIHQINWDLPAYRWDGIEGLREFYRSNPQKQEDDRQRFTKALRVISNLMLSTVDPTQTLGWDVELFEQINKLLSDQPSMVEEITQKLMKKGFWSKEAKEPIPFGRSQVKVSTIQFGEWCPDRKDFTRGEYLRMIWSNLYDQPS
jgi:hypothetical protein